MNENATFEFVVAEIPEGGRRVLLFAGRFALLTVIAVFIFACFAWNVPALAVLPLSLLGVVLYFWKLFNVEFEYSMTSGNMTFSRIYGGMRRKTVLDLSIKDLREIAPYADETPAHLASLGVEKEYRFISSSSAEDTYYAVFEADGTRAVVYFEATEKTLRILRFYNPATVVKKVSR